MQEEIEQVYFYQTRPYFFLYKCKVIKTWENRYIEYSCCEKSVYFEVKFQIKNDCIQIHITDIATEPTNSGIGKSIFAYLLKEAVHICNYSKTENICLSGFLSTVDYINGHWPDSLLAYKRIGQDFLMDFYITDQKTDPAYINCPEFLKKEIYTEIEAFFNPELGKINSGYFYYNVNKKKIQIALDEYKMFIQKKVKEIEETKSRKYTENNRLIQQNFQPIDKLSSLIIKIKRTLGI